jgi:transcriptional regulator with XRE-family HTH domain
MLEAAVRRNRLLPKGWPSRVRSSVVHAVSHPHFSLTLARGVAANSINGRMRIKDSRMLRLPAHRRPNDPPTERLAILELRAARGWSTAEAARRLLVTPLAISSRMTRLDQEGSDALVRLLEPANRFPEFVGYIVPRLKTLGPIMGTRKIAQHLCRAELHLGATAIRRMLTHASAQRGFPSSMEARRRVTARGPNEVFHVDLTTVPRSVGCR